MSENLLRVADRNYNAELCLVGSKFKGPGYHSLIPGGTWAHSTRESIYYALHLLKSGGNKNEQRAFDIIKAIISLQDTNPYNPTYGIWSWLYEEPLDKMSPPDWNWADFIGSALAHVLKDFGEILPESLYQETVASIGHAAWAIFRRNVQPDYTNIAIMGVVVTSVAGEVASEYRLLEYARGRIKRFLEYTREQGGLNEYNSPCYTFVALHEVERIIQLVDDREICECAQELRHFIWESLSSRYHPATKQLAGPHSRAYSDTLTESVSSYIDWAVKGQKEQEYTAEVLVDFETPISCPTEFRNRFIELPEQEIEQKNRFIRKELDDESLYGTTWMNNEASLGSINHECFWTQRRPLLGYWLDEKGEVAVLRLRMLKDGKDFSSGGLHNSQSGNKVLTGIKMYTDHGDFHIHLDRPEDGIFNYKSLTLRYELTGLGANVSSSGSGQYILSCGKYKAAVNTVPGTFGRNISWRTGCSGDTVYLEAVFDEGDNQSIELTESSCVELVFSTELIESDKAPVKEIPEFVKTKKRIDASWQGIQLSYNPYGERYS